ncbi:MAG: FG-GAP-like repeat-containing protein [Planctomycetota bacterium]|nr:FG-GAP-like repeat-containing protein [Planctomycetota bacterium]
MSELMKQVVGICAICGTLSAGSVVASEGQLFAEHVTYPTGDRPQMPAIGNMDGDTLPDVVVANNWGDSVWVFWNDNRGAFDSYVECGTGDAPLWVALGDLDADGDLDMAVANYWGDKVSVIMNNGDRTFGEQVTYDAGTSPYSLSIADLNGDGHPDIAVANAGSDNVSILLNNGDGSFELHNTYSTGDGPVSVDAADLDDDGDLDLAVANHYEGTVLILLNHGDGTFETGQTKEVGTGPDMTVAADLDSDSDPDLALVNVNDETVSILFNYGDATFDDQVVYAVGDEPHALAIDDLDGDGDVDIATANKLGHNVSILLNNGGTGEFEPYGEYAVGTRPYGIAAADLDGDVDIDLVTTNADDDTFSVLENLGPGGPVLWAVEDGGNGHYYDLVEHPEGMNWYDARAEASGTIYDGRRGYLATITSAAESDFIIDNLLEGSPSSYYWLGGIQPDGSEEPDGGWTWITGEEWDYANWDAGEPNNNQGYENVVHVYGAGMDFGYWNDVDGSTEGGEDPYGGYVIEYEGFVNPSNNHTYYLIDEQLHAPDAEDRAIDRGGHLVTINDEEENDWIVATFGGTDLFWIGLTDSEDYGGHESDVWVWMSGEPVSYLNWDTGEPNEGQDGDFVIINHDVSGPGVWSDDVNYAQHLGIVEVSCDSDLNGDRIVNTGDLLMLLGCWGLPCGDVNGDGTTNTEDLLTLLGDWGPCP